MDRNRDELIVKEAIRFRKAIDAAHDNCEFKDTMRYFPKGCCEISSDLFAYYLEKLRIKAKEICGEYDTGNKETSGRHVWVDVNGLVVDLTADQFFGSTIYCGPYTDFYNSMEIIREEKPYDIMNNRLLSEDYKVIMSHLNA